MTNERKYLIHIFPINSPWGVIKHPIKGNIYKHTPLVEPSVKDYYVKKKLNNNKDIDWSKTPNFHIEFIDEVSFYFNRKYDDYTNMDELLASDYCVVKKPEDNRLYYYTLAVDKQNAGSVRFLATLDILFTYHPKEYLSPTRQSFIKQGHEWRWDRSGKVDWKKVLKNNEPIVSIDKTHKVHSLLPENIANTENYSKGVDFFNVKWVVLYIQKGHMARLLNKIKYRDGNTDLPIKVKELGFIKTMKGRLELPYTIFLCPFYTGNVYVKYPFYDNPVYFNTKQFFNIIENLGDIVIGIHLKNFNDLGVDSHNLSLSTTTIRGVKYPLIKYESFKPLYLQELQAVKPNTPEKGVDISNYLKWIGTVDYDKYIKPILLKHGVDKDKYGNSEWDFINMGVLMATPFLAGAGAVSGALSGVSVTAGNVTRYGVNVGSYFGQPGLGGILGLGVLGESATIITGSVGQALAGATSAITLNLGTTLAQQLSVSKGKGGGEWDFSIFCGKGNESNTCIPLNSLLLVGEYFKYLNKLGSTDIKTKIFIPYINKVNYLADMKPFKGKFIPLMPRAPQRNKVEKTKDPILLHPNYYQLKIKKWNSESVSYSYPYLQKGNVSQMVIRPTPNEVNITYGKPLTVNIMYSWQPSNDSSFLWMDYEKDYKHSLTSGDYLQLAEQKTVETSQDPLQAYLRDNKNSFNTAYKQQQASIALEKRRAETSRDFAIGGGVLGFLGSIASGSAIGAIGSGIAGLKGTIDTQYEIESANMRMKHLQQTRQATIDDYKNRLATISTGETANIDTIISSIEDKGDEIKIIENGLSPANESILLNEVKRHGYNVMENKNVLYFINTRERFNYVESDGVFNDITLKLSSRVKQVINDTFTDGITFWHYRTKEDIDNKYRDIKDYTRPNDEKKGNEPW